MLTLIHNGVAGMNLVWKRITAGHFTDLEQLDCERIMDYLLSRALVQSQVEHAALYGNGIELILRFNSPNSHADVSFLTVQVRPDGEIAS